MNSCYEGLCPHCAEIECVDDCLGGKAEVKLDHRHWMDGGTMVTNFSNKMLPVYQLAIERFGDKTLVISDQAFTRNGTEPYEGMKALHHTASGGSLSAFWRIFERCQVELEISEIGR